MACETQSGAFAYWNNYLGGIRWTELPSKWPKKNVKSLSVSTCTTQNDFRIPYTICNEVILSAWGIILSRFTATDDVAFGIILESSPAEPSSKKCFPFRFTASPADTPEIVAQGVQKALRETPSYTRDDLSDLSSLINRGTVVCIIQRETDEIEAFSDHDSEEPLVPIRVSFQCSKQNTLVKLEAVQNLYDDRYLTEVLQQVSDTIESLLGLSKASPEQVNLEPILTWTRPCEPLPSILLLHQWVEKQAQLTPNAIAIGESERVMTYRELDDGAESLAAYLGSQGIGADKMHNVGIFFEKSSYAIMSMLAVLKAGGTYVPLDIAWPEQRVTIVLENANICNVFCSRMQRKHLPDTQAIRVMAVDERSVYELKKEYSERRESHVIDTSTAAYMLYTSGSTGVPKGISVSHRAISTSIQAMASNLHINEETRTFQYTTFTFDLNIADIWMTLGYGGRICLPSEEERLTPNDFITQERCNYAMITPTAASTIDTAVMHANLKTLALIGEAVPERLLQNIARPDSSMKLYNTWGPTEACVIASRSESISCKNGTISLSPNNIGYSLGATMFLVDATDPHRLADPFVPGEIALVGHSLANGYYGNDEKTKEAFRTDLRWARNKSLVEKVGGPDTMKTVYLTGDIGCYNPNGDGTIIFMHRKEGGYIKINGYRVDPGEIESRILELANGQMSLKGTCVLSHEQSEEGLDSSRQILVCFLAVGDGKAMLGAGCTLVDSPSDWNQPIKKVAASLREAMPEYMIPRLFVPVQSLPILTSHKIDRKAMLAVLKDSSWADLLERFGV